MAQTLAFDIYGTLIDTAGVTGLLSGMVGEDAVRFSDLWRQKQLEYSFRRGLMDQYADFSVCTRDALEYTAQFLDHPLSSGQKQALMESYRELPAFPEAVAALTALKQAGHHLYAFSNGKPEDLDALLSHANLIEFFEQIISVHEVQSFKPNPKVYHHFLDASASKSANSWLVSSNPFDVLGAEAIGMNTAWIKRSDKALFDPWGVNPTVTLSSLEQLPEQVGNLSR